MVVNVFLLGETSAHAQLLGNRTVDAVNSGRLKQSLELLRFKAGTNVTVAKAQVTVSDVPPQYFPNSILEGVTYRDTYEEVEVKVIGEQAGPGINAPEKSDDAPEDAPACGNGADGAMSDCAEPQGAAASTNLAAMATSISVFVVAVLSAAIAVVLCKRHRSQSYAVRTADSSIAIADGKAKALESPQV